MPWMWRRGYWVCDRLSLRKNQVVWVLSLHIELDLKPSIILMLSQSSSSALRPTFHSKLWLAVRPHVLQEVVRVAFSARGGKEIQKGRALFVCCPSKSESVAVPLRSLCHWRGDLGFFGFQICFDPTGLGFSPQGSDSAIRLPELTENFCGIALTTSEV